MIIANHKPSSSFSSSIYHPRAFHSKLRFHLFKNSYSDLSDPPIPTLALNYTRFNSYSVSSVPLEMGPQLTLDFPWTIPLIRRNDPE